MDILSFAASKAIAPLLERRSGMLGSGGSHVANAKALLVNQNVCDNNSTIDRYRQRVPVACIQRATQ